MTAQIHIGDIGTVFEMTVRDENGEIVDLAAATALEMIFRNSTGTVKARTATLSTDGTDGRVRYVTVDGDLDLAGKWQVQAVVTLPAGRWSSDVHEFWVYGNLRQSS